LVSIYWLEYSLFLMIDEEIESPEMNS